MNKNDDLVNGRWSNKFYVAIDYNFCSFMKYLLNIFLLGEFLSKCPSNTSFRGQMRCLIIMKNKK